MPILSVKNLSFSYDTAPTLRDVNLDVFAGEFVSIIGPNGSGKSTLLKAISRIVAPYTGSVLMDGTNINAIPRQELARMIAVIPQDSSPQFPFTALEIVLMGRSPYSGRLGFENDVDYEIAREAMQATDVQHLEHKPVTALSGGERQRVLIARALAQQPRLLLMDEPNAHLDIAHQIDIFSIIKGINKEKGVTVVSVSHDLNLASTFSDRIGMMLCGSLVALGRPDEVMTSERIRDVFKTDVLIDRHPRHTSLRITLLAPLSNGYKNGTILSH